MLANKENGKIVVENSTVFVCLGISQACMSSESCSTNCTIGSIGVFMFLGVSDGPCHVFRMIKDFKCLPVVLC